MTFFASARRIVLSGALVSAHAFILGIDWVDFFVNGTADYSHACTRYRYNPVLLVVTTTFSEMTTTIAFAHLLVSLYVYGKQRSLYRILRRDLGNSDFPSTVSRAHGGLTLLLALGPTGVLLAVLLPLAIRPVVVSMFSNTTVRYAYVTVPTVVVEVWYAVMLTINCAIVTVSFTAITTIVCSFKRAAQGILDGLNTLSLRVSRLSAVELLPQASQYERQLEILGSRSSRAGSPVFLG
ncbi:uncharacterized protein LOC129590026 [Paramacrobiotus metropolitanus]|uniref:uncharacterized protein LOC129590026 n=1 Tax=Paramacrobiotus metropolitanus TaxID=2943436 RepID=UPI0024463B24|nr:uncharacterized protein LOC129590026 [Paramacrobiotus metropolitanus]